MTAQNNFAPEDWARVVAAPMLAGIAVTAADPGGLWGAVRESIAAAGAIRTAEAEGHDAPLIREIVAAYDTAEGREMARDVLKERALGDKPDRIVDASLAELGAVSALVTSKAPADAAAFKAWLEDVARKVAEAATEGGFLGFGGVKVSDAEKAALERLASAIA